MDTVRRTRKNRRPASSRGRRGQSEPQLRVVRREGAEDAAHDVDERLSAAVADLRWKLHDVDALRWRRNLIARGAAPLIAMPRGYEHIAQVLNSKRRLDERIADVICGVAKPLLGLVGAAGVAALLATTPLLSPRLVQGFELPRSPVQVLVVVPEQEARWLVPPVAAGAPVVAQGAGHVAPAATTFARPLNPLSEEGRGSLWSAHVLGTPRAGAEQREAPGRATPRAQPAPTSGTTGSSRTPATGTTAAPSARDRTTPSPSPPAQGATQPSPGTQPSPAATPGQGTPTPGRGTSSSTGDSAATPAPPTAPASPTPQSGSPQDPKASSAGTPATATTPATGSTGTSGSGTTPAPTASGTTSTP